MARAKRTDRADARRRYRAELSTTDAAATTDDAIPTADQPRRRPAASAQASASTSTPTQRPGMLAAFKTSFHPVDVRGDLAALPTLIRDKAFWIPVGLTILSAILVAAVGRTNLVSSFATTYFLEAPAIGGVFIAGFLASRASWLLGLLIGILAATLYTVLLFAVPSQLYPPDLYTGTLTPSVMQQFAASSFALSPIFGAFFAASAAWYRRFLRLSNPNRGRRPAAPQRRPGDGRTRSNPQKASARR